MKRNDWVKLGICCLFLCGLCVLYGCSTVLSGVMPDDKSLNTLLAEISPESDTSGSERREVSLYYRMRGEGLLARESRSIHLPKDTLLEEALIELLIGGPSPRLLDLTGLFLPGTKVTSITSRNGMLFVTLNTKFLGTPVDAPMDWESDPLWRAEVLMRRRLALASIVNTITEATNYTAVQLLVLDKQDDVNGRRVTRSELYANASGDQVLGPEMRSEQYILSHYHTANIILDSWKNKDFSRLYRYVTKRPTEAAFQQEMVSFTRSLTDFSLTPGIVSNDGQKAVLSANLEYTDANGVTNVENFPLHMICENGLWKMQYSTLLRLMEAT